jgi:ubiquitin-protein ligase
MQSAADDAAAPKLSAARSAGGAAAAEAASAKLSPQFMKRVQVEIKHSHECQCETSFDGDVLMSFDSDNCQNLLCGCIGRVGTPFEGAFLAFEATLPPTFPFSPPKVLKLVWSSGQRLHPNIYANGRVCMDIINTFGSQGWVPTCLLKNVLLSLQSLLDEHP